MGNKPNTEAAEAQDRHDLADHPEFQYRYTSTPQGMDGVEPLSTVADMHALLAAMAEVQEHARPPLVARVGSWLTSAVLICGLLLALFCMAMAAYALYSWVVG